jgi:hypothetical protein
MPWLTVGRNLTDKRMATLGKSDTGNDIDTVVEPWWFERNIVHLEPRCPFEQQPECLGRAMCQRIHLMWRFQQMLKLPHLVKYRKGGSLRRPECGPVSFAA